MSVMLCRLQFLADLNLLRKFLEMMLKISDSAQVFDDMNNISFSEIEDFDNFSLHLQSRFGLISNILRLF